MKRSFLLFTPILFAYGCDTVRPLAPDTDPAFDAAPSNLAGIFVQEIFTDFRGPNETHAGPGPHPVVESDRFTLSGGIRWFAGGTVEYRIVGAEPVTGANAAIVAGEQQWDGLLAGRDFARNDATTQTNPCTDLPSDITWALIDGPGSVVGFASPCYILGTKEIVGFSITLDNSEPLGTTGGATVIDVGDVATHEFGHVVGLAHVNGPRDGCLTMYRFVIEGEIQKRTPGLGDKLGMAKLYANTNTTPGACGS
jgi:hypothetical protein